MEKAENYEVKDMSLAQQGMRNIEFAEHNMGSLMRIKKEFESEKPLKDLRIGMALHVTKDTAVLVRTLIAGGAQVAITGCNPLSTQDDVAAALAKEGIKVWAHKGESKEDYYRYINNIINFKPNITIDDGCDLVSEIHLKHPELIPSIIGGCEETTTGIVRLHAMEKDSALKYPVIAVNDNKTKHLLDNFYGTGQSAIDGIIRATNILFAGKTVAIIGYGSCGKGAAKRAHGLGANVVVCEVDAFRALVAHYDGYRVMPIMEAVKTADMFLTVTGNKHVVPFEAIKKMKDGVILANAGHFDIEIDIASLEQNAAKKKVRTYLDEYNLNGKKIFVAGEGRLINLSAAEGHPSEVMATSFCGQALAVKYLAQNRNLKPGLHQLPTETDDKIARYQLEAMNVVFDCLTEDQKKYLSSWQEGT